MRLKIRCAACGGSCEPFLDLGRQPLSDAFRTVGDTSEEYFYELRMAVCTDCSAVQLEQEIPRDKMFNDSYPFRTSSSKRMAAHFADTAQHLVAKAAKPDPFIVEFGCNDGTMLSNLAASGVRHLGIDPAANLISEAIDRGVTAQTAFFESSTATQIVKEHGPADVVYAANTLCHIPYLDSIFAGLDVLLDADGLFIFEDPYLGDIVRLGSFDQIYDEHYYLFSATSVQHLAKRHGFTLLEVTPLGVHGGELRYTIGRQSGHRSPSPAVEDTLENEASLELHSLPRLKTFAETVAQRRSELRSVLEDYAEQEYSVAGYAATAKSATVLNYCGIGPDLLPIIFDTTPEKQGKLAPGSHIPVAAFPESIEDYPDVFVLFAWNHSNEILEKEKEFITRGGHWVQYVPEVRVVR